MTQPLFLSMLARGGIRIALKTFGATNDTPTQDPPLAVTLEHPATREVWGLSSVDSQQTHSGVVITMGRSRRQGIIRSSRQGPVAAIFKVFAFSAMLLSVHATGITTDYLKPTVSSKACVGTTELIATKTEGLGNSGACMQCDPANNVCPPGCQALIDNLYVDCDGVTLPDGLFYDPSDLIDGEWSDHVKAAIKIATERCGCDGAGRAKPVSGTSFETFVTKHVGILALAAVARSLAGCMLILP
ncbi:unnamed protein product [Ascophyllum nodosum]